MIKDEIIALINEALKDLVLGALGAKWIVEHSAEMSHGDYSTNVAMVLAKQMGENPHELASKIVEKLKAKGQGLEAIENVSVAGPGFINFFLSRKFFEDSLKEILEKGDDYGKGDLLEGKKYIVEYSSPNIAKPFTIGHLRSTIIGDAVANLLQSQGAEVIRDNHLGDWGSQFGKMIAAIKKNNIDLSHIEKGAFPMMGLVDSMMSLVELYIQFH